MGIGFPKIKIVGCSQISETMLDIEVAATVPGLETRTYVAVHCPDDVTTFIAKVVAINGLIIRLRFQMKANCYMGAGLFDGHVQRVSTSDVTNIEEATDRLIGQVMLDEQKLVVVYEDGRYAVSEDGGESFRPLVTGDSKRRARLFQVLYLIQLLIFLYIAWTVVF